MSDFDCLKCQELILEHQWVEAAEFIKLSSKKISNLKSSNLMEIAKFVKSEYISDKEQKLFLQELLRMLRNLSTISNVNIFENSGFLNEILNIFKYLNNSDSCELITKVLLQFLVNSITSNPAISSIIADSFYDEILECYRRKKNNYEVLALLYNIHLHNKTQNFEQTFYKNILESFNSCEYSEFLIELFIYNENFWINYENLEISNRLTVLEILKKLHFNRKLQEIPKISIEILCKKFTNSMEIIFQTVSSDESLEPYEISIVLDILGSLCSDEQYLKLLQLDKDLIIRSGVVLINLHRLGKLSNNCFSSIQKLSELKEPNETIQKHPAFGFKVGLVRLIGNLCWKNKKMQDLAREAELIPVLLDCCNIDARNPLIMQWVIFAIRNLCDNNLENQRIIEGLHKEGTVSSALIEEMGLTLHNDESGGIRIVPLDLRK